MTNTTVKLIAIIKEFAQIDLNESTSIESINLDSLDLLDLQMQIDDFFNIEIPIESFIACKDISDVSALIDKIRCK